MPQEQQQEANAHQHSTVSVSEASIRRADANMLNLAIFNQQQQQQHHKSYHSKCMHCRVAHIKTHQRIHCHRAVLRQSAGRGCLQNHEAHQRVHCRPQQAAHPGPVLVQPHLHQHGGHSACQQVAARVAVGVQARQHSGILWQHPQSSCKSCVHRVTCVCTHFLLVVCLP